MPTPPDAAQKPWTIRGLTWAFLAALGLITSLLTLSVPALRPAGPLPAPTFARDIRPLLESHCLRCHNAKKKSGGVDFSTVTDEQAVRLSRKLFRKALGQLEALQMPPEGARPLSAEHRRQLVAWMKQATRPATGTATAEHDPGPAPLPRLSLAEYDNTIRDLLGVEFKAAEEVGMTEQADADNSFGNLAAGLDIPPALLDKYFAAADKILDRFLGTELRSEVDGVIIERARHAREKLFAVKPDSWRDPRSVIKPPAGVDRREAARRIVTRFLRRAYRRPVDAGDVNALMKVHDRAAARGADYVGAVRLMLKAALVSPKFLFRIEQPRAARPGERGAPVDDHELATRLSYFLWSSMPDSWLMDLADRNRLSAPGSKTDVVRLGGRPLGGQVSPHRRDVTPAHAFDGDTETWFEGAQPDGCWVGLDLGRPRLLRRIRYAAWRGATDRVVGGKFQAAPSADFRTGVVDLFTIKSRPTTGSLLDVEVKPAQAYRYVRYLAPPKSQGFIAEIEVWGIAKEPVLEQQVRRMLADPRARALTDNFAVRWLQLHKLASARPSTEFFPEFQPELRKAMYDETTTFFDMLRQEDRDVRELLKADYTYLNESLAGFYGISGVRGKELRRVALRPEHHRGGVLGMGSVLALTSHTSRTSPTLRGKWVLDVIFGTPPPPPPADAGMLKEEKGKGKEPWTFREQLQMHANRPACMSCHRKLDPLGFALENYNAVGKWRTAAGTRPLDTTGVLPTGEKLDGVASLKRVLRRRQVEFVRNLTEQLLTYALGREVDYYDDGPVETIQRDLARGGHRFAALVLGVVTSYPFRHRRGTTGTDITGGMR